MKTKQHTTGWLGLALACGAITLANPAMAVKLPPPPEPTLTYTLYPFEDGGMGGSRAVAISAAGLVPGHFESEWIWRWDDMSGDYLPQRLGVIDWRLDESYAHCINENGLVAGRCNSWAGCGDCGPAWGQGFVIQPAQTPEGGLTWFRDGDADGVNDLMMRIWPAPGEQYLPWSDDPNVYYPPGPDSLIRDLNDPRAVCGLIGGYGFVLVPDFSDADGDGNPWFAADAEGNNSLVPATPPPHHPTIMKSPVLLLAALVAAAPPASAAPIPLDHPGTVTGQQYQGDALDITATADGALLRCGFQQLEGRATASGLALASTTPGKPGQLRLVAAAWGRAEPPAPAPGGIASLPPTGTVSVEDRRVRFARPGVTEEYFVSMDGVRQDFLVTQGPAGAGDLWVELALSGAQARATADGVRLRLEGCGRELAYGRLRAEDATGRALVARLEVLSPGRLAVRVDDAGARYPVRIDPTFTDADWVSLNPGLPGASGSVRAMAVDGDGNLYVGGLFDHIGTVAATNIAKWDGETWSALGPGLSGGDSHDGVLALLVVGTDLYAGGGFATAGGVPANHIAKWDGSTWSALGLGVRYDRSGYDTDTGHVHALAVIGTDLYAGGLFNTAGGMAANHIAKWNGSSWSTLGAGFYDSEYGSSVEALAVIGTDLYAGGFLTKSGDTAIHGIARWDGGNWVNLGSGVPVGDRVHALAVRGTDLYAGGSFVHAGGVKVNRIARWNGGAWLELGSGVSSSTYFKSVLALAVSGSDLYAGGYFTTADGMPANHIAKWDGSTWSALGSGVDNVVHALADDGAGHLLVGGSFHRAGNKDSPYLAWANLTAVALPAWYFERAGGVPNKLVWRTEAGRSYDLFESADLSGWSHVEGYPKPDTGGVMEHPFTTGTRGFFKITSEASMSAGFVLIPAGSFLMGDQDNPLVGDPDELPVHSVYVSAFHMGKYEVTKELWDAVRAWGLANGYTDLAVGNGSDASKGANHPVHSITWYDMVKWSNACSEMEGLTPCYTVSGAVMRTGASTPVCNWNANGYRLPTEAEWEKAARGGLTGLNFPWGTDTITHSQANYYSNSSTSYDVSPTRGNHPIYNDGVAPYTSPVGSFAPNGYGLYDMAGNQWEWCWDWYSSSYYPSSPGTDPRGPATGSDRVIRGGSWHDIGRRARCAYRSIWRDYPNGNGSGFRLARGQQ